MISNGKVAIFLVLFFLMVGQTFAQNVEISKEKTKIDGKPFFVHTIKKGETLYAISKTYDVLPKVIAMYNPEVFEGLKIGQVINIPDFQYLEISGFENRDTTKFIYHIIEKGQTLYSLTKKYNVSIEQIEAINHSIKDGLKEGQTLIIPKQLEVGQEAKNVPDPDTLIDNNYILHVVNSLETLYAISKKYDISIRQIKKYNPELKDRSLKEGETIRIPITNKDDMVEHTYIADTSSVDTVSIDPHTLFDTLNYPCDSFDYKMYKKAFNIALILPFNLDAPDISDEEEKVDDGMFFPSSKPFLEFYEGFLFAVDSVKKQGVDIELLVYNTQKDSARVAEILQKKEFANLNLIVGPAFSSNLSPVANFAKEHKICLVSPFYPKKELLSNNPYVFQINPSIGTQMTEAFKNLKYFSNANIVFLHNGDEDEKGYQKVCLSKLKVNMPDSVIADSLRFWEVVLKEHKNDKLLKALSKTRNNLIVIPSTNQAFVSDIITRLYTVKEDYMITLIGSPSWSKFDNIELEYIHGLNMFSYSPFYVDYSDSIVKNFVVNHRNVFASEPTLYSFFGYDVGFYFLSAMKEYGLEFQNCLPTKELLQSRFSFSRSDNNDGFENTGVYMINYSKEFDVLKVVPDNLVPH